MLLSCSLIFFDHGFVRVIKRFWASILMGVLLVQGNAPCIGAPPEEEAGAVAAGPAQAARPSPVRSLACLALATLRRVPAKDKGANDCFVRVTADRLDEQGRIDLLACTKPRRLDDKELNIFLARVQEIPQRHRPLIRPLSFEQISRLSTAQLATLPSDGWPLLTEKALQTLFETELWDTLEDVIADWCPNERFGRLTLGTARNMSASFFPTLRNRRHSPLRSQNAVLHMLPYVTFQQLNELTPALLSLYPCRFLPLLTPEEADAVLPADVRPHYPLSHINTARNCEVCESFGEPMDPTAAFGVDLRRLKASQPHSLVVSYDEEVLYSVAWLEKHLPHLDQEDQGLAPELR